MELIEWIVWLVASIGWMLDWASTVWPNEELPEQNPFVIQLFGEYPGPVIFGLGKAVGLVIAGVLYIIANNLFHSYSYLPTSLIGINTILFIPSTIGIVGWHGFLHNLRPHIFT
ncbi:MAG: hypothetical protein ACI8VE_001097 [Natrialbaceae archaeon]|jgi:hypothetical protein